MNFASCGKFSLTSELRQKEAAVVQRERTVGGVEGSSSRRDELLQRAELKRERPSMRRWVVVRGWCRCSEPPDTESDGGDEHLVGRLPLHVVHQWPRLLQ